MTDSPKQIYWDSCCWLGLINQEPGKADNCNYVIEEAKRGRYEIWTSSITRAEVFKVKCDEKNIQLQEKRDRAFEDYLEQDFVVEVPADRDIGTLARRLMRENSPPLNKPNDAIHLATAIFHNLDECHTYDKDDLLRLNGEVYKRNGELLTICKVPERKGQQRLGLTTLRENDGSEEIANGE